MTTATDVSPSRGGMSFLWRRQLDSYPDTGPRIFYLALTVLATITLYYELYVGGSVSTLILANLHMSFTFFVIPLAFGAQLGRGTAMGFWTSGPVVGSLIVAVVGTNTVPAIVNDTRFWTHEYHICGIAGLVVFLITLFGLRELSPRLRDQLMVTMRDRALVEARAKGLNVESMLQPPFRQLLKVDVVVSSLAISIFLLIYYSAVAFLVIYITTVFGFTVKQANGLGNWA